MDSVQEEVVEVFLLSEWRTSPISGTRGVMVFGGAMQLDERVLCVRSTVSVKALRWSLVLSQLLAMDLMKLLSCSHNMLLLDPVTPTAANTTFKKESHHTELSSLKRIIFFRKRERK